jgi:GNAT superfamily N-acetyltransferase
MMREVAERMEREALLDLCTAAKERLGLEWHAQPLGGGVAVHCPSIDNFWFNRVLGLGRDLTLSRAALAEQIEAYGAARLSRFFVHLCEDPRPAELPAWLEALGVPRYHRSWHQLGRGRDAALPVANTTLRVRPATAEDEPALAELFALGFHLPPLGAQAFASVLGRRGWHCCVATEGELVVAAGLLFVAGDAGYLGGGVTRPEHRGRGAQLALLVERCRLALDLGCRHIVSETGEPVEGEPQHSHRNMERCGLRVLAKRHNYAPAGALWR